VKEGNTQTDGDREREGGKESCEIRRRDSDVRDTRSVGAMRGEHPRDIDSMQSATSALVPISVPATTATAVDVAATDDAAAAAVLLHPLATVACPTASMKIPPLS